MIIRFLAQLLKKDKTPTSVFSSALEEGIMDTVKQMGYSFEKMRRKNNNKNKMHDGNIKDDDTEIR
jgi:hypothetical protein